MSGFCHALVNANTLQSIIHTTRTLPVYADDDKFIYFILVYHRSQIPRESTDTVRAVTKDRQRRRYCEMRDQVSHTPATLDGASGKTPGTALFNPFRDPS